VKHKLLKRSVSFKASVQQLIIKKDLSLVDPELKVWGSSNNVETVTNNMKIIQHR